MKKNIILQLIFILLTANNLMSQTTTREVYRIIEMI